MVKNLIAVGFLVATIACAASAAWAADDSSQSDTKKDQAASTDKAARPAPPVGPMEQDDEWGPPGPPRGKMRGNRDGRMEGPGRGGRMEGPGRDGGPMGMPGNDRQMPMPPGLPGGPFGGRGPFHDWTSLEQRDPDLFKVVKQEMTLERQTRDLVEDYARADFAKRAEIKKELQKTVEEHFNVRQQRRQLELKRLEEELQRLREAIERRNEARKQIIDKRVSELLNEQDGVGF